MNKKYFGLMTFTALAALSSCSSEDAVQQQKSATAISEALYIRPMVNNTMRAAYEYSTGSINMDDQQFRLIGTGNFAITDNPAPTMADIEAADKKTSFDDIVTYTGGDWNLSANVVPAGSTIYWADKVTKATFKAVAPKDIMEGSYTVLGGTDTQGYTAATDCRPTQQDIIVAYNEGTKKDFTSGVPINFRHVLSRIQFQAVNKDQSNGLVLEIQGVKLVNIASKASLSYPNVVTGEGFSWEKYSPWANASTAQWYYGKETAVKTIGSVASEVISGNDFYLLPQQLNAADKESLAAAVTTTAAKSKQYFSFRIRAYYTSSSATDNVKNTANTNNNIWPFAKVATAFTTEAGKAISAGFIDKTTFASLTATDKTNGSVTECDASDGYAWAAVPVDTEWLPGKKYVYTLNYSAAGLGIVDPEDGGVPGEDIIPESPLKLWFTVTVSDWENISNTQNL